MCARLTQVLDPEEIRQVLRADTVPAASRVWNGPPNAIYAVCRLMDGRRALARLRWGLTPRWSHDLSIAHHNARSETVWRKPSFREAAERRRAVMPVNGWFEWLSENGLRQPYYISLQDGGVICLAAIWEPPAAPDADETFAVLTTEPRNELRTIHHRQPALLEPETIDAWLDPATGLDAAARAGRAPGRRALRIRRVHPRMNSAHRNEPGILDEIA